MNTIDKSLNFTVYGYSEVTFTGSSYKLHSRMFDSYDDAKGCMMMYIHHGGMTTILTEFQSNGNSREDVIRYFKRYYKNEETVLNGQYQLGEAEGYNYHEDYFLKAEVMSRADIDNLNKVGRFIDKYFASVPLPSVSAMDMYLRPKKYKEASSVIEIHCDNEELIKLAVEILKKSEEFTVIEDE